MAFNDVIFTELYFQRILDYQWISKPASLLLSQILDWCQHHHHFFIDLIFNSNNNFGKNWSSHLQIAEEIALLSLNASCSMIHGTLKRAAKRCSWRPCFVPCQYLQLFTAWNKTHLSLRGLSGLLGGVTLTPRLCGQICILHIYGGLLKFSNE